MNIREKIKNMNRHINMDRETKLDIIELSRGYVGAILLAILMFNGVVSAMYAGENYTFQVNTTEDLVYTIVGNTYDMEGFQVYQDIFLDYSNITFSVAVNYKPDNFTVVLFENITNDVIIEVPIYSSGGHSTKYVYKNVTQNETIYIPEYITNTETIEVEKIIDNTEIIQTGYELWHVLLAMAIGGAFCWFVMRTKDDDNQDIEKEMDKEYQ